MARRLIAPLLLCIACAVQAQIADPTKPAIDTGAAAAGLPLVPATAGLQSIIQRKGGKPAALINGVVVELGGKLGEARLVKIGDDFVVLRGAMGNEILRLTPDAEKKAVKKEKK
ncbi:MAG: hypothetical protein AB1443_13645 [Pseudomonadota bacterium]